MRLTWHTYKYFPYERDLASREVAVLLGDPTQIEMDDGIEVTGNFDSTAAARLTYFSGYANGKGYHPTVQSFLEDFTQSGKLRQATRYSMHGLHDYKGKFNPQVARSILNIFGVKKNFSVFDPFCGSGTTLVECAHMGAIGVGTDINPLAVFIANAKLFALTTPFERLEGALERLKRHIRNVRNWSAEIVDSPRTGYLRLWFDAQVLNEIEIVRRIVCDEVGDLSPIFLVIASNLLRDYSQQDPNDLRIRRRTSPLPEIAFRESFISACEQAAARLRNSQSVLGLNLPLGSAILSSVTEVGSEKFANPFDAAITSPPYAMALPYIDTQRLSLVWLDLITPDRILSLEAELIGSREIRGSQKRYIHDNLLDNTGRIPDPEHRFCLKLQNALGPSDGFRRKAVPSLLYRYFSSMKQSFRSVKGLMKPDARFALIVGHNHTVLGGVRRDINTPEHLVSLASSVGWELDELIPLQTYRRYGYHAANAVEAETLIILKNV